MKGIIFVGTLLIMATSAAAAGIEPTPGFDYNQAFFWLSAASSIGQLVLWIYVWNARRNQVSQEKMHDLELRLTKLEGRVDSLPTQTQMQSLGGQVSEIDGDMKEANEKLKGLDKRLELLGGTAQRIEEFLLQNSGGNRRR